MPAPPGQGNKSLDAIVVEVLWPTGCCAQVHIRRRNVRQARGSASRHVGLTRGLPLGGNELAGKSYQRGQPLTRHHPLDLGNLEGWITGMEGRQMEGPGSGR